MRLLVSACAGAMLLLGAASPAAAQTVADAGALRASVSLEPWRLSFGDGGGASVLSEVAGTGTGDTGTLGFRTATDWYRATRVLSSLQQGGVWSGELETTDPIGRRLTVNIRPDAEGVIAVSATVTNGSTADVTRTGIAFAARPSERYLGFGERSNAVDQRGGVVESFVGEGALHGHRPTGDRALPAAVGLSSTRRRDLLSDALAPLNGRLWGAGGQL